MHRQRGITLIELATTMTLLAICTAVGMPALRAFIQQQRALAATGSLTVQLANARLAAVTQGRPVVLCPVHESAAGCVHGTDWSRGWLAFFDPDGDRRPGQPDEIIAVEQAPAGGHLRVSTTSGRRWVRYLPNGANGGSNVTFTICGTDGFLLGEVIVNMAGRVKTERPSGSVPCT